MTFSRFSLEFPWHGLSMMVTLFFKASHWIYKKKSMWIHPKTNTFAKKGTISKGNTSSNPLGTMLVFRGGVTCEVCEWLWHFRICKPFSLLNEGGTAKKYGLESPGCPVLKVNHLPSVGRFLPSWVTWRFHKISWFHVKFPAPDTIDDKKSEFIYLCFDHVTKISEVSSMDSQIYIFGIKDWC